MTDRIPAAEFRSMRAGKGKAPRVDHEGPIHIACLNLARWKLPGALIHHSPNEQSMEGTPEARRRAISRAKELGMLPGFSDLFILWRGRMLLVEVKAGKNTMTDEQRDVADLAMVNGAMFACVWSLGEMEAVIADFKALPPLMAEVELRGVVR